MVGTHFRERWPSTTPTSLVISTSHPGGTIETHNGESTDPGNVELNDRLIIETTDGQKLEFEVVGLVEDEEQNAYAVAYNEKDDQFVVTDAQGTLLSDDALAQEILDDFQVLAEEAAPEEI